MPQLKKSLSSAFQRMGISGRDDEEVIVEPPTPKLEEPESEPAPVQEKYQNIVFKAGSKIPKPGLTFRLAIEFGITMNVEDVLDPLPADPLLPFPVPEPRPVLSIESLLAQTLNTTGLGSFLTRANYWKVLRKREGLPPEDDLPDDIPEGLLRPDNSIKDLFQDWSIGSQLLDRRTILVPQESSAGERLTLVNYRTLLETPILVFCNRSLELVREVMRTIGEFAWTLFANRHWSFTVHIGAGDHGFSDDVTKNIIATLWAFEKTLDHLHPQYRVNNPALHLSRMCDSSALLGDAYNVEGAWGLLSDVDCIKRLLDPETTRNRATELVNYDESACYIFDQLYVPYRYPMERGVEFRQHESTVDADRMEYWVRVCAGIIRFMKDAEPVRLWDLLLKHAEDGEGCLGGVEEVLRVMEMQEEAEWYAERVFEWESVSEGEGEDEGEAEGEDGGWDGDWDGEFSDEQWNRGFVAAAGLGGESDEESNEDEGLGEERVGEVEDQRE